jgi:protein gp37
MGETTGISWCDHTFNAWWGCWKIADECKNCYADATAHRYASQFGELWGRTAARRFFPAKHWLELGRWNKRAERDGVRRRVFVGSMMDWAEVHPDPEINAQMDAARLQLATEVRACTSLDFLFLTKRIDDVPAHLIAMFGSIARLPPNLWIGMTAGTRKMLADVGKLRRIPAAVRFISCEPILEDIPAAEWDAALGKSGARFDGDKITEVVQPIDWLIVGDESGPGARDAQPDWVRNAREAAVRHGVAFHFKQWAGRDVAGIDGRLAKDSKSAGRRKIHLPILDGRQWAQFPAGK